MLFVDFHMAFDTVINTYINIKNSSNKSWSEILHIKEIHKSNVSCVNDRNHFTDLFLFSKMLKKGGNMDVINYMQYLHNNHIKIQPKTKVSIKLTSSVIQYMEI